MISTDGTYKQYARVIICGWLNKTVSNKRQEDGFFKISEKCGIIFLNFRWIKFQRGEDLFITLSIVYFQI